MFRLTDGAQGFYHDSSFFTSLVTSIDAGASDDRHCVCERERERERECAWPGYPRGYEHYKLWSCPGSNPSRLCARRVIYPLRHAPRASLNSLFMHKRCRKSFHLGGELLGPVPGRRLELAVVALELLRDVGHQRISCNNKDRFFFTGFEIPIIGDETEIGLSKEIVGGEVFF